jgi:hypothetical protein
MCWHVLCASDLRAHSVSAGQLLHWRLCVEEDDAVECVRWCKYKRQQALTIKLCTPLSRVPYLTAAGLSSTHYQGTHYEAFTIKLGTPLPRVSYLTAAGYQCHWLCLHLHYWQHNRKRCKQRFYMRRLEAKCTHKQSCRNTSCSSSSSTGTWP